MFIEEVIAGYVRDMQDRENVSDSVDQALNSTVSLSVNEKDQVLSQVEFQSENFKKLIEFSSFLLKSAKRTKLEMIESIQ